MLAAYASRCQVARAIPTAASTKELLDGFPTTEIAAIVGDRVERLTVCVIPTWRSSTIRVTVLSQAVDDPS